MGRKTDDLSFFRDRGAFAIERDRLERSTNNPPFDRFEERTVETHKAADVMDAMLPIDSPQEAKAFVAGYARDFVEQHGFSPDEADEVARENLSIAVAQLLTDHWNRDKKELWHSVLR